MTRPRLAWLCAAVACVALMVAGAASAQTYPDRPVRMVVAFPAGAQAFNPQPDPPAKQKAFTDQKNLKSNKASVRVKTTASGAPCSPGASCGAIDSYKGTKK